MPSKKLNSKQRRKKRRAPLQTNKNTSHPNGYIKLDDDVIDIFKIIAEQKGIFKDFGFKHINRYFRDASNNKKRLTLAAYDIKDSRNISKSDFERFRPLKGRIDQALEHKERIARHIDMKDDDYLLPLKINLKIDFHHSQIDVHSEKLKEYAVKAHSSNNDEELREHNSRIKHHNKKIRKHLGKIEKSLGELSYRF